MNPTRHVRTFTQKWWLRARWQHVSIATWRQYHMDTRRSIPICSRKLWLRNTWKQISTSTVRDCLIGVCPAWRFQHRSCYGARTWKLNNTIEEKMHLWSHTRISRAKMKVKWSVRSLASQDFNTVFPETSFKFEAAWRLKEKVSNLSSNLCQRD